jgi:hypothetical protein
MANSLTYELSQPSAFRREWLLSRDGQSRAVLRIPMFRSGAQAEIARELFDIERAGHLRIGYVVRDATGGEVARLRRDGGRRLLDFGGRAAEWKRLGRKEGFGFVDRGGTTLVRARVSSGLFRSSGEVEVNMDVPERDGLVAALLASFLLIRKNEDEAGAVVAATTVASSG